MVLTLPHSGGAHAVAVTKLIHPLSDKVSELTERGTRFFVLEMKENDYDFGTRAYIQLQNDGQPLGWVDMFNSDGSLLISPLISQNVFILAEPRLVRRRFELTSEEVGTIPAGTKIQIVKLRRTNDGAQRVAFVFLGTGRVVGWLTSKTVKEVLMIRQVSEIGESDASPPPCLQPQAYAAACYTDFSREPSPTNSSRGSPTGLSLYFSSGMYFSNSPGSERGSPISSRSTETPRARQSSGSEKAKSTPRTPRTPSPSQRLGKQVGVKENLSSRLQATRPTTDAGSKPQPTQHSSRPTQHKKGSKKESQPELWNSAKLKEMADEYSHQTAMESDKLTENRKTLRAKLGDHFVAKKIKPNELVQSWAKRGEEPISRMEFRQHVRKLLAKADTTEIDQLFDDLDADHGGTLDVSELKASLRLLKESAQKAADDMERVRKVHDHLMTRLEVAKKAVELTAEYEKLREAAESQLKPGALSLEQQLGIKLARNGYKVQEIVAKWADKGASNVSKDAFKRNVAALVGIKMNEKEAKPGGGIEQLFSRLDESGLGQLDVSQLKDALNQVMVFGKETIENQDSMVISVEKRLEQVREAQEELAKMRQEDAISAEEQAQRAKEEEEQALLEAEAAVAAKAAAEQRRLAQKAAQKAAFEEKVNAKRASSRAAASPTRSRSTAPTPAPASASEVKGD